MQTDTGQLIVQFEGKITQTIPLTTSPLIIGRAPEVGLTLAYPLVSREHAEVLLQDGTCLLTDLGSSNGTFIGNEKIAPRQPRILTDGMSFRIGPYFMTYRVSRISPFVPDEPQAQLEALKDLEELDQAKLPESERKLAMQRVPTTVQHVPRPVSEASDGMYTHFLPDIYQENDFLQRFLFIFEDVWEPLEARQDHIHMYFEPLTCPVVFLPWIAGWLGITLNPNWPEARRRRLLSQAIDLYRWRGTRYGLTRMIEICTGVSVVITEKEPFVFNIKVPIANTDTDREIIEELIQSHKPAHAGYTLDFTG